MWENVPLSFHYILMMLCNLDQHLKQHKHEDTVLYIGNHCLIDVCFSNRLE